MKQLREHIKKIISHLAEEKYQAPAEIVDALKMDLMLNPLIRYVKELKGTSFMIYYEDFSLMVKIGTKEYYLGDEKEKNFAIKHINKLLTSPKIGKGEETDSTEDSETVDEPADEPAEEPAEEEPEA